MSFQKGHPRLGGRQKGQASKYRSVSNFLASISCDPFKIESDIASGVLPCGVCHGSGKTKFQPRKQNVFEPEELGPTGDLKLSQRTCQSCYGSGKERISPELRHKAAENLSKYCQPQLKAIEHSGTDGGAIKSEHIVRYVEADPREKI